MTPSAGIPRLETGISGLDLISGGGLPRGRAALVTGTAGAGKTTLAIQFLAEGVRRDQSSVLVTFQESPEQLRQNAASLGWDLARHEHEQRLAIVDATEPPGEIATEIGGFDLDALLARIRHAAGRVNATRLALDSLDTLLVRFQARDLLRRELGRILAALGDTGLTTVVTAERTREYGPVSRHDLEEFVADSVIVLRNVLEQAWRRRTAEVLKMRGCWHLRGEHPFSVHSPEGIVILPMPAIELTEPTSAERVSSGSPAVDAMCGGGFFRGAVILVSGATGTGKTLIANHFAAAGPASGERSLLLSFEESRPQLVRNAGSWGFDLEKMEHEGFLRLVCAYPESAAIEDHLYEIKTQIDRFHPQRIVLDSMTALQRPTSEAAFRQFMVGLSAFSKAHGITVLATSTAPTLAGAPHEVDNHVATISDGIILLRHVERYGTMSRGIGVLKLRGSAHDKAIREIHIDATGLHIGDPFSDITGVIADRPTHRHI